MSDDLRVPATILMTLGLAGCNLTGPCLSIAHTGACLSIAHTGDSSNDCDTNDPDDTDCEDTGTESQAEQAETRSEIKTKVLARGVLPVDVANRLTD